MGIVSAIGLDLKSFTNNLFAGSSGITLVSGFDTSDLRSHLGAQIRDMDFSARIHRKDAHMMDPVSKLAVMAADQALEHAGLILEQDRRDLGVIVGSAMGPAASIEESYHRAAARQNLRPTTILKLMLNSPGAVLCARYQCRSVSNVHVTACAASAHAIVQGAACIRLGETDVCLVGGCEAFPSRTLYAAWDALGIMSPERQNPARAIRPFSADRNGFAIGEGAAFLVLESESRARKRGAPIYAELLGSGSCSHTPNLTRPSVEGMKQAMSLALSRSGLQPLEVGYVNAQGSATAINDLLETEALHGVFGQHARQLQISSSKAAIGHAMGASGAMESVATIQALNCRLAPPTLNLDKPDPQCDLNYTANHASPMPAPVAMTNSFAFGGHYVSLIFGRS